MTDLSPLYFQRKKYVSHLHQNGTRAFRERRAIARARLRTRLTRWRRAIYRSPEILATVHDD